MNWAESVAPELLYISAITVLELELGVLRIERRDKRQGKSLRRWFEEQVLPEFSQRTLAVDAAVARASAPTCTLLTLNPNAMP